MDLFNSPLGEARKKIVRLPSFVRARFFKYLKPTNPRKAFGGVARKGNPRHRP
jgi:hypothetical protein